MALNSLREMKKSRKSLQDKIVEESKKTKGGNYNSDERIWAPTVDKADNGFAIIRFLPPPKGEELPWVRVFDHGFQGPGGWYIEKSLTTIAKDDPVSEYNSKLWNNGTEEGKKQAREQKRRLKYYANIYVVKDPEHPENEGKVFLYKFGKTIFDKINEAMNPEDEYDDNVEPINPFDFWEGANFRLKIRNKDNWRSYDKSYFDEPSALSEDDDELEKIWETEYSLEEFLDPSQFKSYDELKTKLHRVLGINSSEQKATRAETQEAEAPAPKESSAKDDVDEDDDVPWKTKDDEVSSEDGEDGEDALDFFKNLADED